MILKNFSSGYFVYDLLYLLKKPKWKNFDVGYVLHHLISMYIISNNPHKYSVCEVLFWAELSNIPSYFLYILRKNGGIKSVAYKKLSVLYIFIYLFIRFPILGHYLWDLHKTEGRKTLFIMPLYVMGLVWGLKLCRDVKSLF